MPRVRYRDLLKVNAGLEFVLSWSRPFVGTQTPPWVPLQHQWVLFAQVRHFVNLMTQVQFAKREAEMVGLEPTVAATPHGISSAAPSVSRSPLLQKGNRCQFRFPRSFQKSELTTVMPPVSTTTRTNASKSVPLRNKCILPTDRLRT
jgi:hypothetical protein